MTYLLWVAGVPLIEFLGEEAEATCAYFAAAVEGTYHAATVCTLLVGA